MLHSINSHSFSFLSLFMRYIRIKENFDNCDHEISYYKFYDNNHIDNHEKCEIMR